MASAATEAIVTEVCEGGCSHSDEGERVPRPRPLLAMLPPGLLQIAALLGGRVVANASTEVAAMARAASRRTAAIIVSSTMPRLSLILLPALAVVEAAPSNLWAPPAFVPPLPAARIPQLEVSTLHPSTSTALHASKSAAKKKKTKKASPKAGGGFGTASPKKQSKPKDAIMYPDLDPQVLQTLVPSPTDGSDESSGGTLSEEMYDRLEEIYGLEKFNFGGEGAIYKSIGVAPGGGDDAEGDGGSLFDDILSGGAAGQSDSALDGMLSPGASTPAISLGDIMETKPEPSGCGRLNAIPPFEKFRVLHTDPMVLAIDDFFTPEECDRYVQVSLDAENNQQQPGSDEMQPMLLGQSQTVGKDSRSKAQRTSTTWFHHYAGVPELMAKASRLLGLEGIERFEEPQTVRYRRNERFTWHLDALGPEEAAKGAGQRAATLLVYLTDLAKEEGGATMFRDLGGEGPLKVRPKKGSALLFFPSAGGIPNAPFDIRTLHCGEAVAEDATSEKWIAQLWLRQRGYEPTAPAGNAHGKANDAIGKYCDSMQR
ncbi:hypothetical protein ACHAXT_009257 [Thalassiosira profunda]